MSDFTDKEDRQLVQLARMYSRNDKQIPWQSLAQTMKDSKKRKDVLRQRLKTLKRTHGPDLEKFPAWFFKKEFSSKINHQLQESHQMRANAKTVNKQRPTTRSQMQSKKSPTKPEKSPMLNMSTCFQKCTPTKVEPLHASRVIGSIAAVLEHKQQNIHCILDDVFVSIDV
ncbi:Hypothetical protein PHPALM_5925 [Phytophthora palmivora]|uniref:Uncharacterized protein n=1 Tax=Phytophthora palmivora TaxID=4796 RepID=A0A2P4YG66_9STRA|nr:Hypothetical protein PHPALM_5925 [Phytophthora palmivora]